MRNLDLFSTASIDHLLWSSEEDITELNSPAVSIFTDFDHSLPLVVDARTTAVETVEIMEKTHAYMRLVVDKNNTFLGIVTKDELLERKILKQAQAVGESRNELSIRDMMIHRESLLALDYHQIKSAKVSDVIRALQTNGLHHILVIDQKRHHIRGLISANDISRKLNIPVDIAPPPSFQQIFNVAY
ncbi:CBS domain-containing protein [uncultured Shewanella sp.]|uniref:CBS domain-containing protein n=1 Tax=uncultured Shewanella sp. TaxID=173975 RepID=UPI0026038077|nr:CBS domain-containing protein [uncultured Shewanella sp.]